MGGGQKGGVEPWLCTGDLAVFIKFVIKSSTFLLSVWTLRFSAPLCCIE